MTLHIVLGFVYNRYIERIDRRKESNCRAIQEKVMILFYILFILRFCVCVFVCYIFFVTCMFVLFILRKDAKL